MTDLSFFAVTQQGVDWEGRVDGYDDATFPVMSDTDGKVYPLYGASAYDAFLIDRQGRLVTRFAGVYDNVQFPGIRNRLRDLHAE